MAVVQVLLHFLLWRCSTVSAAVEADEVKVLPGWNGTLPSKMYSGFIDPSVYDGAHHIHYLFIESEGTPSSDPVVLWVQGGPGGSSMEGAFSENMGPFQLYDASLATTPPTLFRSDSPWTGVANMLFWEAPSGVGFSYCDNDDHDKNKNNKNGGGSGSSSSCPAWNDTTSAAEQASFICDWFAAFPEYQANDFFLVGESYAGVYIPTTAYELLANGCPSSSGAVKVNLKGVAVGNGCTGTDAGTCSPQRSVNTFEELAAQGFVSLATAGAVRTACADSAGFTRADAACQAAVLEASAEAGPFNNYDVHDTCGDAADGSTLASFICGETPGAEAWACSGGGGGVNSDESRGATAAAAAAGVPWGETRHHDRGDRGAGSEALHYEGPRGALYGYGKLTAKATKSSGENVKKKHVKAAAVVGPSSASLVGADDSSLYPETYPCNTQDALATWLSEADVMDALHVSVSGQSSWPGGGIRYSRTAADLVTPPAQGGDANGYPYLIDAGLRVLIYSGDFDGQVPHFGTEQWTRGLGEWYGGLAAGCEGVRPWTADDDGATVPAGRFVQYAASGEFTFLTVARAGHMVPTYRPKEALTMLKRFLAGDGY